MHADADGSGARRQRSRRENADAASTGRGAGTRRELLVRSDDARLETRIFAARAVQRKASDGEIEAYRAWSADDRRNRAGTVSPVASERSADNSCDETGREEIRQPARTHRAETSEAPFPEARALSGDSARC